MGPSTVRETWQSLTRRLSGLLVAVLVGLIRLYQRVISPVLGPRCRFVPTCSCYAVECLKKYGVIRGLPRAAWRVCRCHPLGKPGYDPP
jgi:hypothetical protein